MSGPTYQPPLSPQIAQWLAEFDDDVMDFFQERAAVREHMGGFSREQAENLAWADTQRYVERRDTRKRTIDLAKDLADKLSNREREELYRYLGELING